MSRLFPKPRPAFEAEYVVECNTNNLKYVTYFSMLSVLVFGFHLVHHFRLGLEAISAEMIPYTLLYSFAIIYPLFNILFLHKLKDIPALTPVASFIQVLFPFFMGSIAVILSALSSIYGLGVTPFAIIMMVICFTLQGQFVLLASVVSIGFLVLSILLLMNTQPNVYSPLIAISFTTTLASIIIANVTEHMRINQFEVVTQLNANNRQLQKLSQQDHLTNLLNRRAIDHVLERELSRSERFNHDLSLLIIDVDDFKYINDAFGHVFGDQVLVEVAESIKLHVRDVDYVGRIGGDEFIVILIETTQDHAIMIADRMRGEVLKLKEKHQNANISISIGHASSDGESHVALIEKADKALYLAKRAGKNKVRSLYKAQLAHTDDAS